MHKPFQVPFIAYNLTGLCLVPKICKMPKRIQNIKTLFNLNLKLSISAFGKKKKIKRKRIENLKNGFVAPYREQ